MGQRRFPPPWSAEETESHINESLRLSPRDAGANRRLAVAGVDKLLLGHHEEAVALLRGAIDSASTRPAHDKASTSALRR
jgi:hypothetical protein